MMKKNIFLILLFSSNLFALEADINNDGIVNLIDFFILSNEWLKIEEIPQCLVSSGWLDIEQEGINYLEETNNKWRTYLSTSQNNHVARSGIVWGVNIYISDPNNIIEMGFLIVRYNVNNYYIVLGKSQIFTLFEKGINKIIFSSPIRNVLENDIICLCIKSGKSVKYLNSNVPINDINSNLKYIEFDNYDFIKNNFSYNFNNIDCGFKVLPVCALMESPKVIIVGDSISEGSPLNRSYRNNSINKSRECVYAGIAYNILQWDYETGGNTCYSNNYYEVVNYDLTSILWRKRSKYLHVHCGVNDIYDERTWGQVRDNLNTILIQCRNHNVKMIIDAIFPWTGNNENTTGTHNQNIQRDIWNMNLEDWANDYNDVYFINVNFVLGQEREVPKIGDPEPMSGNLWNLVPEYVVNDGLGIHLNRAGCLTVGRVFAVYLNNLIKE